MNALVLCAAVASALIAPAALVAPPAPDDRARLDSIADATARDIARFADKRVAVAEGYRRVGPDFPGMGEHWVHPGLLLAGTLDSRRPTMLAYANIAGRPTLLGAGFVLATRGDAIADAPGWPTHWHEHSGLLAEASGVRASSIGATATETHIWILHIWTSLPNPSGRYGADNWALPFAQHGIVAPAAVDHDAGQAAGLTLAGGDDYLRNALSVAGLRTPAREAEVDAAIVEAAAAATKVIVRAREELVASAADTEALRGIWGALRTRLRAALGPEVDVLLTPAPAHAHAR